MKAIVEVSVHLSSVPAEFFEEISFPRLSLSWRVEVLRRSLCAHAFLARTAKIPFHSIAEATAAFEPILPAGPMALLRGLVTDANLARHHDLIDLDYYPEDASPPEPPVPVVPPAALVSDPSAAAVSAPTLGCAAASCVDDDAFLQAAAQDWLQQHCLRLKEQATNIVPEETLRECFQSIVRKNEEVAKLVGQMSPPFIDLVPSLPQAVQAHARRAIAQSLPCHCRKMLEHWASLHPSTVVQHTLKKTRFHEDTKE